MSLRNLAIIAHVDHGKTTLVDELLKQSGTFRANQQVNERVMDSNDLEKERGITILAKCTSVDWQGNRMNIVDTPGHADFGGEVERILSMVDGVVLLVDAAEGPMPQTKFVTTKALALGLRPIVVINKIDKSDARPDWVVDQVFDLFVALGANDEQLDFPVLYASAKNGWANDTLDGDRANMEDLFKTITDHIPQAKGDETAPFRMLATTLEADPYLGRILTGRILTGVVKVGDTVNGVSMENGKIESARVTKILQWKGLEREAVETAKAGEIVAIAGLSKTTVADTICTDGQDAIQAIPISPPTMSMTVSVNDSPFVGQDGDKLTGNMIGERLYKEAETNVSIKVSVSDSKDAFDVAGRGELQLGVLIENMRREGFEMTIAPPRVIIQETDGEKMEPIEEVTIDVDEEFSSRVVEKLSVRKGDLREMNPSGAGKVRLVFHIPSRGLIGYQGEFLSDTRGTGILSRGFLEYAPYKGKIQGRHQGVLISSEQGRAVNYALNPLQDRGILFVKNGDNVYNGMIVGEHSKDNDLEVNVVKAKQLTNFRAAGKDEAERMAPPREFSLETAIAYIADDERLEVTPENLRLRKAFLCPHERKKDYKRRKNLED